MIENSQDLIFYLRIDLLKKIRTEIISLPMKIHRRTVTSIAVLFSDVNEANDKSGRLFIAREISVFIFF